MTRPAAPDFDTLFPRHVDLRSEGDLRSRLPTHGGVYLITNQEDHPVVLAACESLRRVLWERLDPAESAPSSRRADLRPVARYLRYQPTYSVFESSLEFHRLARLLYPHDYLERCSIAPVYWVHIDPEARIPVFTATDEVRPRAPGTTIGPFPTRPACKRYVELLTDLFDLCRYDDILRQSPNGQPCEYFDMGRCPAPCNGSVTLGQYRDAVTDTLRFATQDQNATLEAWREQMRKASLDLAFETAARMKTRLDRAALFTHRDFKLADDLRRFHYLAIQRASGSSTVKPFFIHWGYITQGEPIRLQALDDDTISSWFQSAWSRADPPDEPDDRYVSERLWIVARYLFKADRAPGLFFRTDRLPNRVEFANLIRRRFSSQAKSE